MKVTLTKQSSVTLDADDLWSAVMGSGWETWPWWQSVKYLEGDWDVPGRVQVSIDDPDAEDAALVRVITLSALIDAVHTVNERGFVDLCTGRPIDWEDLDACVGDLVLQIAIFGKEIYA